MRNAGRTTTLFAGLIVLVAAHVVVLGQSSSPTPPTDLKLVGDHWTPWDPPAAAEGAYLIQKGDTLWDLASQWLGDPFLWPQVWDENRYILDSHWIYPGDPLVIPGRPTVVPAEGPPPGGETPEEPAEVEAPAEPTEPERVAPSGGFGRKHTGEVVAQPKPEPTRTPMQPPLRALASDRDIYCSGRIAPDYESGGLSIVGVEDEREHMSAGDVIFLNQGEGSGVRVGDEYALVRPTREISHPVSGENLGTYIRRLGKARVMLVQSTTATAVIEMSCEDLMFGDLLEPWTDIPVPMGRGGDEFDRFDPGTDDGVNGVIVTGADRIVAFGEGHVVLTDLGVASGVSPGDVVTMFRSSRGMPRVNLARGIVLSVEPGTSTVKLTHTIRELQVGDHVQVMTR